MKSTVFQSEFTRLIQNLLAQIPTLKVESVYREKGSRRGRSQTDILVTLRAGGKTWTLICEVKRLGQPHEVRGAVGRLKNQIRKIRGVSQYAVVLAPYISPQSARICDEEGVGYADLSGNAKLSFGNIFIATYGKENAFKQRKEVKSLFTTKSQRALRVLLQGPLRPWKISRLAEEAKVSLGWASALKQQLVTREWAVGEREGLLVTNPVALLEAWAAADDWGKRTEVRQYSLLEIEPVDIASNLAKAIRPFRFAFTQWFAGWLRHQYTLPPIVTAYVDEWPEDEYLEKKIHARRVDQGGRLWLVKPRDEGVFHPSQQIKGFPLVADVQIYLDLLRAGQRGEEQAAALRKQKDFAGGWPG